MFEDALYMFKNILLQTFMYEYGSVLYWPSQDSSVLGEVIPD